MYFSKITLSKNSMALQKLNSYIHKNGYYYHQLLWDLFSEDNPEKKRDFLYRSETTGHWPCFYTVSATIPQDIQALWEVNYQEYNPKLSVGESLHFRLRANPRICRKNDDDKKKYFDVVQDAWQKNSDVIKNKKLSKNEIMQAAGEKWLTKKAMQHGFKIEFILVENFHKEFFKKKNQHLSFSTVDFVGRLIVMDSALFLNTLFQGIGSAKGFGCGLLMVKR